MQNKIIIEFFPELELHIPKSHSGDNFLKPMVVQSKNSFRMYILAQLIRSKYNNKLNQELSSVIKPHIIVVKKYTNYKTYRLGKKLGIKRLPALVLNGIILCQGKTPLDQELNEIVEKIIEKV